jgi:molybdate transport system substrate-binding protein
MRVFFAILCFLASTAGVAAAADLKLLTTTTYHPAVQALLPEFEKRTGHKVTVDTDTASNLAERMAAGEPFDVVVITARALAPYLGNRVIASSVKAVARAGIGVAVREGTPLPDIAGIGAFRNALLAARAVAYIDPASGASSGLYLDWLFERLGIAEQIKAKAVLVRGGGPVTEKLMSGEADIGLQQRSELVDQPGIVLIGPIPLELQNYTLYSGGISVGSRNRGTAEALLQVLADPKNIPLLKKLGLSES